MPEKEQEKHLGKLRADAETVRAGAMDLLVRTYVDADAAKTLPALDDLATRYGGDPNALECIEKVRQRVLAGGQQMVPGLDALMQFPTGVTPNENGK